MVINSKIPCKISYLDVQQINEEKDKKLCVTAYTVYSMLINAIIELFGIHGLKSVCKNEEKSYIYINSWDSTLNRGIISCDTQVYTYIRAACVKNIIWEGYTIRFLVNHVSPQPHICNFTINNG